MKRQHKVVVGSRTWSNCRKALAKGTETLTSTKVAVLHGMREAMKRAGAVERRALLLLLLLRRRRRRRRALKAAAAAAAATVRRQQEQRRPRLARLPRLP
jgi:C4-dicarboxylate-specific signal transduction histidine kinase